MNIHSTFTSRPLERVLSTVLSVTASAAFWALSGNVYAAAIGVNFHASASPALLSPTDAAGAAPFSQTNFNNIPAFTPPLPLVDNSGTPTTATLSISQGSFSFSSDSSDADEQMNRQGVFSTGTLSFTINNIPYANYSLIVYDFNNGTGGAVQRITAGGATFYSSSPSVFAPGYFDRNPATPFIYTLATSTNPAAPTPNSNYVVFTGLTGLTQNVTAARVPPGSTGFEGVAIGGFQIVETVPEPSTGAMLLGGLGLLSGFRRFRSAVDCPK